MRFEFATSNRIVFGKGSVSEVPKLASVLGRRAFVAHNLHGPSNYFIEQLKESGLDPISWPVGSEPTIQSITEALNAAREGDCDLVIGIGGGSTLDTGKAVSILLSNSGELQDYLEIVGAGRVFENPSTPFIAIPTTAGTGTEVTRNAVIGIPDRHLKVSLRSPHMLPRHAVIDPELTYTLPPEITATTGMDALTQLIEPFVCNSPTPITDALCWDGIPRVARSLFTAYKKGTDVDAREDMALASMFGGMALANARLGAVHGLASPLGGMTAAPHGAICAFLLTLVIEANLNKLKSSQTDSQVIDRYREVARLLTGNASAIPEDAVEWTRKLCLAMKIKQLAEFGLKKSHFPGIVGRSQKASSMKGNPVPLTDAELTSILEKAI